jgi:hypothetical protein
MQNTQLTIADLASLRSLLQAAYSRGAFRIEEASQVGTIFDRLARFLDEQQQAAEQAISADMPQGESNA